MIAPYEIMRSEMTAIEVDLKLGTAASIGVETDDATGPPILWINAGGIQLLVMPSGLAEGGPLTSCDLLRADELVGAAAQYREAIAAWLTTFRRRAERLQQTEADRQSIGGVPGILVEARPAQVGSPHD